MKSLGATALIAALSCVSPCYAAEADSAAAPAMRAGFDADTGRFRPLSAEEQQALARQGLDRGSVLSMLRLQQAKSAGAKSGPVLQSDGSEMLAVPEEFFVQLRVERGADGQPRIAHDHASLDTHRHAEAPHE